MPSSRSNCFGFFLSFHSFRGAGGKVAKIKDGDSSNLDAPYLGNPGIHDVNVPGYSSLILQEVFRIEIMLECK